MSDLLLQQWQVVGVSLPNQGGIGGDVAMNECIAHIYYVAPRHLGMLVPEIFCQEIGCLTDNHDVIDDSMKAHDVSFHVLKRLLTEIFVNVAYALVNMPKAVDVPNCLSHR